MATEITIDSVKWTSSTYEKVTFIAEIQARHMPSRRIYSHRRIWYVGETVDKCICFGVFSFFFPPRFSSTLVLVPVHTYFFLFLRLCLRLCLCLRRTCKPALRFCIVNILGRQAGKRSKNYDFQKYRASLSLGLRFQKIALYYSRFLVRSLCGYTVLKFGKRPLRARWVWLHFRNLDRNPGCQTEHWRPRRGMRFIWSRIRKLL